MANIENPPKSVTDQPSLSPRQVCGFTGGAITVSYLKNDRIEAEQNGTSPKIPYYRLGHRTIRYRPEEISIFLNTMRVE
jgi:hypothetical protein